MYFVGLDLAWGEKNQTGVAVIDSDGRLLHVGAASDDETDWTRITALYTVLAHVAPSPIVELNRAVAVGRSHGPAAGLAIVDTLTATGDLASYPQLPAVRADLLERTGRPAEAAAAYRRAAELTHNEGERSIFLTRAATLEVD